MSAIRRLARVNLEVSAAAALLQRIYREDVTVSELLEETYVLSGADESRHAALSESRVYASVRYGAVFYSPASLVHYIAIRELNARIWECGGYAIWENFIDLSPADLRFYEDQLEYWSDKLPVALGGRA